MCTFKGPPVQQVNIMMKNVVDVVLGGLTYWAFGYGLSYGEDLTTPYLALGSFFVEGTGDQMGPTFTNVLFQVPEAAGS